MSYAAVRSNPGLFEDFITVTDALGWNTTITYEKGDQFDITTFGSVVKTYITRAGTYRITMEKDGASVDTEIPEDRVIDELATLMREVLG